MSEPLTFTDATAHVDAMPGPDASRTLHFSATLWLPTSGWTWSLDEADNSGVGSVLRLTLTVSRGSHALDMVTEYPITGAFGVSDALLTDVHVTVVGADVPDLLVPVTEAS